MEVEKELEAALRIQNQMFREYDRLKEVEDAINSYRMKKGAIENKINILKQSDAFKSEDQMEELRRKCRAMENEEPPTININNQGLWGNVMDEPQPLIVTKKDGKLLLTDGAKDILTQIDNKLTVVAIVGKYRTGKSYLMNRLINRQTGFPLGGTIEAKTKGIWFWLKKHPTFQDRTLLLIDTEGLSDIEKGDANNDIHIFVLAVLLSNVFVYNSVGTIDDKSLQDLHLVAELSKHMKVKANSAREADEDFAKAFPEFIWTVRDAFLDCEVKGKSLTPDEYLEWALSLKQGHNEKVREANAIRGAIKASFVQRSCYRFPRPTEDEKKLRDMGSVAMDDIKEEFLKVADEFTGDVLHRTSLKLLEGKPVKGGLFLKMVETYVDSINKGTLPCIQDAVTSLAESENAKASEEGFAKFIAILDQLSLPMDVDALGRKLEAAQDAAISVFVERVIFDQDQKEMATFAKLLEAKRDVVVAQNDQAALEDCKHFLTSLYDKIMAKKEYMKVGGYQEYSTDMRNLEKEFRQDKAWHCEVRRKSEDAWNLFLSLREQERMAIMKADQQLNAAAQEVEQERLMKEKSEREAKEREREVKHMNEEMERKKKDFENGLQQLRKELADQAQREKAELTKKINTMRDQREQLIKSEFKAEADRVNRQLQALEREKTALAQRHQKESASLREEFLHLQSSSNQEIAQLRHQLANVKPKVVHVHHGGGGGGGCILS